MLPEVESATLNTIGDGLRRSAQRFANKEAIIFSSAAGLTNSSIAR